MSFPAPYLSIVFVARNDNYGGDFNSRLQTSVNWLASLAEKNKLPAELIIVDYNSISDNEPLADMVVWPKNRKYLSIRLLHIPNETHAQFVNPDVRKTVPVFEFVAKNMAIRRAKGEFILGTNADILLHPAIFEFIARQKLDKNTYYRAERFDYKKIDSYDFRNPDATLKQIQQKVFRLLFRIQKYKVRWGENFVEVNFLRLRHLLQVVLVYHILTAKNIAIKLGMQVNYQPFLLKYHTNASGDFMLMHRDHWHRLRGYPEDTYISTHCDSIFAIMANIAGVKENILPWPVYHQDHERRFNTSADEHKKNKEMGDMFRRLIKDTREMESTRQPKIVNPPDWGKASENFTETVI